MTCSVRDLLTRPDLFVQSAYVCGEWSQADDGQTISVDNPATQSEIGTVPRLKADAVTTAIARAHASWPQWRSAPAGERADILMRWYQLMMDNHEDLATILTLEQGKPLSEARSEISYGAGFVRWFAEEARRVYGDVIAAPLADRRVLALKEPVGVSVAITPWNFPNAMITRKCAAALAAGCPVVVKPSEFTPFSALALAVLAQEAGLPKGVLSVVTGLPAEIGEALTGNPIVRKLSFTGSTNVGKVLMRQSADTVKRLSLELGGNAPFVIFDDANIDLAIDGLMASKFRNGGQTCVCANRILVQKGIYDSFANRLAERVSLLKLGDGLQADTTLGPLINTAAVEKVQRHVEDALTKGAKALVGGRPAQGLLVAPTVLTDASRDMVFCQEETFGPAAALLGFGDEAEALEIANDTPYGLAAYFYTEDMRRGWRFAESLEVGMVGLNTGSISMAESPFGGVKESGLGREGSKLGIDEYLETKAFHIGL